MYAKDRTEDFRMSALDIQVLHNRGYDVLEPISKGMNGIVYIGICNEWAIKRYILDKNVDKDNEESVLFGDNENMHFKDVCLVGKECAIKWVPAEQVGQEEQQNLIDLKHPNIVEIFDVINPNEDNVYIVSEYMESGDFNDFRDPLDECHGLDMCRQLVFGLAYMHRRGLIHGDLHSQNVMLTNRSGHCIWKFVDFGAALQTDPEVTIDPNRFIPDMRGLGYILSAVIDITVFQSEELKAQILAIIDRLIDGQHYSHLNEVITDLELISPLFSSSKG